jgi:hypothetical protein
MVAYTQKIIKEDATKKTNSSNIVNEVSRKELFKLFFQNHECIKIDTSLKLPPPIATFIMNTPPIMVVPHANGLRIQLPKYHDNKYLVLHIR